jgi:DDE superfamily endonuclease.
MDDSRFYGRMRGQGNIWEIRSAGTHNTSRMLKHAPFADTCLTKWRLNLKRRTVDLTAIPSGTTSQNQPLDVTVNKLLKFYLKKQYETWLLSKNVPLTPSGNTMSCFKKRILGLGGSEERLKEKHWNSRSKNDVSYTHLMVQRMIHYQSVLIFTAPTYKGELQIIYHSNFQFCDFYFTIWKCCLNTDYSYCIWKPNRYVFLNPENVLLRHGYDS